METIVFCHGMPGSPADAELLRRANPKADIIPLRLLDLDPEAVDTGLGAAFDAAVNLEDHNNIHLVGFSIGAMAAIKIAVARQVSVARLTLASPAAPLSLGNFLPDMAGKQVFLLAMRHPRMLDFLTGFQRLMTRISPAHTMNLLFSNCGPVEKELLNEPDFRGAMAKALSHSFIERPDTYLAFLRAYVADWSNVLSEVCCPVELWHGTGDTWSPYEMSAALKNAFGEKATLHSVQSAEHYSTLARVVL